MESNSHRRLIELQRLMRPRYVRFFGRTLTLVPILVALLVLYMLAFSSQVKEFYLTVLEGGLWHGLLGAVGVLVLSALLYAWHHEFATQAMDRDFPEHGDPFLDGLNCVTRNWKANVLAVLPVLGLLLGLWSVHDLVKEAGTATSIVGQLLADKDAAFKKFVETTVPFPAQWFAFAIMGGGALAGLALGKFALSCRKDAFSLRSVLVVNWWASLAIVLFTWTFPVATANAAGWIGALGTFCIIFCTIIAILSLITRASFWGVPLMAVLVFFAFGIGGYQIYRQVFGERDVKDANEPAGRLKLEPDKETILTDVFDRWLASRRAAGSKDTVPVFIFALQGGGIYAASAGATLLARLEDRCPGFSRHVFAVSGVSGGAVGTVLFNSIVASLPESPRPAGSAPCLPRPVGTPAVDGLVQQAIKVDHLAPIGVFFVPDLIRKMPELLGFRGSGGFGRAEALEHSLSQALVALPLGRTADAARKPFAGHWSEKSSFPAPVLGTTWVETGYRVAFAPFPLKPTGDGTLYSFADPVFAGTKDKPALTVQGMTVLQAAVVSARFPGTMAAWRLDRHPLQLQTEDGRTSSATRTWNFVDGGYADGSGVSTAHEMFNKLKKHIQSKVLPVDLRLVVLTETPPEVDLSKLANGTRFSDTVAPISALMNVRSLLAARAVTSAAEQLSSDEQIAPSNLAAAITGRLGKKSSFLVVRLNVEDFPLTLGWSISSFSNSKIHLMLGQPDLCRTRDAAPSRAKDTVLGNSCVQREILSMLGMSFPPLGTGTAAAPL